MLSLTRTRAWVAGTVVLSLLLAVAAYFLLISPKQAEAAELDTQTESTQASNAQLQSRVAELQAQFADLPQTQAELAAIRQALPESTAMPALVRELDTAATTSGVTLTVLTPGVGTAITPAGTVTTAAAPTDGSTDAAATDGTTTAAAPAATGDLLVSVPITMDVVGGFFDAELFLRAVQTELNRAFLVTDITLTAETAAAEASGGRPAVAPGDVSMTVTGSVFVLRSALTDAAVTTAAGTTTPTPVTP